MSLPRPRPYRALRPLPSPSRSRVPCLFYLTNRGLSREREKKYTITRNEISRIRPNVVLERRTRYPLHTSTRPLNQPPPGHASRPRILPIIDPPNNNPPSVLTFEDKKNGSIRKGSFLRGGKTTQSCCDTLRWHYVPSPAPGRRRTRSAWAGYAFTYFPASSEHGV